MTEFFKMRFALLMVPLLALAACATPETRVRTALIDAGVSRPVASCMAQRMVNRLSLGQLQKLSRLSGISTAQIGQLSVGELLRRTRALGDPEVLTVVTTAGLGCAIAS
jgi:hypothetical protein